MGFLVLLAVLVGFVPGVAQQPNNGNVKIEVRKMQNGQVDVQQDSRAVEEVGSLQDLLDQYGAAEELGDLQPGEEVEIIIRRRKKDDVVREMVVELDSDRPVKIIEEAPKRPLLGVYYSEDLETGGGLVTSVMDNTAAEKAGLLKGDVIIQLDKEVIQGINSLQEAVAAHKAGDKVKVVYLRDGQKMTKNITLGENNRKETAFQWNNQNGRNFHFEDFNNLPSGKILNKKLSEINTNRPMLGVTLSINRTVLDDGNGNREDKSDVTVQGVLPGSAASAMGIRSGDKIRKVNGQDVKDIADIRSALGDAKAGDEVRVSIERNGDGNLQELRGKLTNLKQEENTTSQKRIIMNGLEVDDIDIEELENMDIFNIRKGGDNVNIIVESIFEDDNNAGEVREFRMTVALSDVSNAEAEALSAASGEEFSGQSNLDMARFSVGPNPSNGMFNLSFELPTQGKTQLRVLDLNGEEIYKEDLGMFRGTYDKDFNISNFAKGVYFLQISQGDRAFTKKVVTQ